MIDSYVSSNYCVLCVEAKNQKVESGGTYLVRSIFTVGTSAQLNHTLLFHVFDDWSTKIRATVDKRNYC